MLELNYHVLVISITFFCVCLPHQRFLMNLDNNSNYVEELREWWLKFKSRLSFYRVYKNAMKPPMSLSAGKDNQHNTKIICIFMFVSVY